MERFRVRCNKTAKRYKKKSEKLLAVQRIADDINKDLSCGWSPLHETEDARLYTPLPDLREKFLDGSLMTLTCSGCGFSGVVEYPLLYHDIDENFAVFFDPESDARTAEVPHRLPAHLEGQIRMRLVHTQDDFREKIYIFRDKLDDRIVELVKDAILREMDAKKEKVVPDALYYAEDRFACEGRSLIFVPRRGTEYLEPIKIPFTTYENIKKMMLIIILF